MRPNRKSIAVGLTLGALAGGAGAAFAASGTNTSSAPTPQYGSGPGYNGAGFMGMGAMRGAGQGAPIAAAASYLGLNQTQLQTQLRSGQTLAEIANARGKSVSGLESAMIEATRTNLDANTALSSSQKASILAQIKERLATRINTTCPHATRGAGRAGGLGPMMMRG
jgi:hypothetical protein